MEPLQPLRVADIGLAPRHVLGITRVDKEHSKPPRIEKLENRDPVDAGRFHDDGLDAAFRKPVYQPMQMAAAFGCTTGIVRSILDFHFLRFISTPPADIAEGLSCAIDQIPKRDRRCGVTTLKSATAHGPGFLTGLHATKIVSAAPFRTQSIANPFLSHRGRAAPRSVF